MSFCETLRYNYDKLGNRTSTYSGQTTAYSRNSLNQYTNVGGTSYSYDPNGNLTYDGTYNYYYDCENRLTKVKNQNETQTIATYKYDYKGRRVIKTAGGTTTKYVYDGDQIIAEYEGSILVRKFIYGPGIDEPVCMIDVEHSNAVYYYHFDALGSVVALSNNSGSIAIVEKYSYDVYGKPTIRSPQNAVLSTSAYGNPYMFTGRAYDSETGLYYYRARYYKPSIGRFLQTDPVGYSAGLNLYRYCSNNPANFVDPFGLIDYDTTDTRNTMDRGKTNLNPFSSTIPPESGGNDYKYSPDNFNVPFFWGTNALEGSQFGNMEAGYKNTYQYGIPGALGAYGAGLAYATWENNGRFWVEWTDGSAWNITEGVFQGLYERYTEFPWERAQNLLKGMWNFPGDTMNILKAYAEAFGLTPPADSGKKK